jgi:glycine/D-amino acid oxidase-like deaminating enzyme
MLSRRTLLGAAAAIPAARLLAAGSKPHIAVIGAGAFGGWTAVYLQRLGARVTLVDAWGPGNSRASSGGETRVIRATYADRPYVDLVVRALELWRENERRWDRKMFFQTGVIWMTGEKQQLEHAALGHMRDAGVSVEQLTAAEAAKLYPQINFENIRLVLREKDSGFLTARRNCEYVLEGFLKEGGEYRQVAAEPGSIESGKIQALKLSDGSKITADAYAFCCGPWLGKVFPAILGDIIHPTRQEVFFFGAAAGDARYLEARMPTWIDNSGSLFYGIPGNQWRGFKVATDVRGPVFDPTEGERLPTSQGLQQARQYMEFRFPGMRGAPLLEARVCQYENTPDHHFLFDRHPQAENVWLAGGGSGHGYKHGPAVGEKLAGMILGKQPIDPFFSLASRSRAATGRERYHEGPASSAFG